MSAPARPAPRARCPRTLPARPSGGRALGAARRPARCHQPSPAASGRRPRRPPRAAPLGRTPPSRKPAPTRAPSSQRPPPGSRGPARRPRGLAATRPGSGEHRHACALTRREIFHAFPSTPVRTRSGASPFSRRRKGRGGTGRADAITGRPALGCGCRTASWAERAACPGPRGPRGDGSCHPASQGRGAGTLEGTSLRGGSV